MKTKMKKLLTMVFLPLVIIVSPASGIPIGPGDFGSAAEVEDFEGLANVVFTEVLPPNKHYYLVRNDYSFNGDFTLTQPSPNPPESDNTNGMVIIGDFTQDTEDWGLGNRNLDDAGDLHSGSAYLGGQSGPESDITMTFTFNSALLRVGAWVDDYWVAGDVSVTLSAIDFGGSVIESVATTPGYWTFLGIESEIPIWAVSITGDVPVVDDLTYEVPEPATVALLGLGSLTLLGRNRKFNKK